MQSESDKQLWVFIQMWNMNYQQKKKTPNKLAPRLSKMKGERVGGINGFFFFFFWWQEEQQFW